LKTFYEARCSCFTPVILATQEEEIRTEVQSQPRQIAPKTLPLKNPFQRRAGGVAQGIGPDFKSQYHKKKKKRHFMGMFSFYL
jgi:hypothetical protein